MLLEPLRAALAALRAVLDGPWERKLSNRPECAPETAHLHR